MEHFRALRKSLETKNKTDFWTVFSYCIQLSYSLEESILIASNISGEENPYDDILIERRGGTKHVFYRINETTQTISDMKKIIKMGNSKIGKDLEKIKGMLTLNCVATVSFGDKEKLEAFFKQIPIFVTKIKGDLNDGHPNLQDIMETIDRLNRNREAPTGGQRRRPDTEPDPIVPLTPNEPYRDDGANPGRPPTTPFPTTTPNAPLDRFGRTHYDFPDFDDGPNYWGQRNGPNRLGTNAANLDYSSLYMANTGGVDRKEQIDGREEYEKEKISTLRKLYSSINNDEEKLDL